ncbi:MAG: lipopolysaccharide assembly protein LapA domain-containing protein [Candidatus Velamenicoccus archaeovorus]
MSPRLVLGAVALLVFVVFAAANFKSVEVNFLFFTTQARVITVIVVAGLLGALIGYLAGRPGRAERKRLREGGKD